MKPIKTNNFAIGEEFPVYIIAEIGSNHNGNFDLACELIEKAADAKVNAVKFQTFKAKNHYSRFAEKISLYSENVYDLIESLEIDRSWHKRLAVFCKERSIDFLDSPCDFEAVDLCVEVDMRLMKIASFDMVDARLVDYISRTKRAIMFSSGMANLAEIESAIDICKKNQNDQIVVLQCTSLYPAPYHLSNLAAMRNLKSSFDVIVGYSDHTIGDHVAIASVAMGAKVIEKHYTLDRSMKGPDHQFSIEPHELEQMVAKIREVETSLGDGLKNGPRPEEMEMYQKARRSIFAKTDIRKGDIIKDSDIIIKRPNTGIHPSMLEVVIGREAKNDIPADFPITWSNI